MRNIPSALQVKLDGGATTLCRCWIVTRNDGVIQGFTDHDENVVVDGVTCLAAAGLNAAEATQKLGLAVTGSELSGALFDDSLTEADLAAGRYDAAGVAIWLVDWSEPELAVLLARGVLGEVRRSGNAFTAELRGLTHRLAESSGRLYTASCSVDLGGAACGLDLDTPTYTGSGTVTALDVTSTFHAEGLDAYADDWFTRGRLVWSSGANDGLAIEVKLHRAGADGVSLSLWQAMPEPIAAGDAFTVTAGCDKRFASCRERFDNAVNFRGFPHIPGNDFIVRYPVQGEPGNTGASLRSGFEI
jgi:uncharacterized phage protein (TIGR02218 family)